MSTNPKISFETHREAIQKAIVDVAASGVYIFGPQMQAFEKEFASYIGCEYGVGVNSGTDALTLALRACDVGKGDEVITSTFTVTCTVAAIELAGAEPVLVDIDPDTFTLNCNQVEQMITGKTKAIIPVHLYGCSADMDAVMEIAERRNLWVIEDACQAHGATYNDKKVGSIGHAAAFSFYPTKNLGAMGDAGMVVTNRRKIADVVTSLRRHAWNPRYVAAERKGVNSFLDEIQAAILRVKLSHLAHENSLRQVIATRYYRYLRHSSLLLPKVRVPDHVYHQYVVRTPGRNQLKEFLRSNGIETLIHNPLPVCLHPAYENRVRCAHTYFQIPEFEAKWSGEECLSLPIYPEMPIKDVIQICNLIKEWDDQKYE